MSQSPLVRASTTRSTKKYTYKEIEIGTGHWHIKDYYLYVQYCWETHILHVGNIKADETKSLKLKVQIPLS